MSGIPSVYFNTSPIQGAMVNGADDAMGIEPGRYHNDPAAYTERTKLMSAGAGVGMLKPKESWKELRLEVCQGTPSVAGVNPSNMNDITHLY